MNSKFLLPVIFLAAFSSCSTAYKTGQTPDDVYFSPTREYSTARVEERREPQVQDRDEAQIRMGINNRRWRTFDYDYDYNYSPYAYGYSNGYYYNPNYCTYPVYNNIVVVTPSPVNTTPRKANLGGYGNGYTNNNVALNNKYGGTYIPTRSYNNTNRRTSTTTNQNNTSTDNTRSYNTPSNTNTNTTTNSSSSSSSSSSGSTSSGGAVSRPARKG
jgi:hypothetical protein